VNKSGENLFDYFSIFLFSLTEFWNYLRLTNPRTKRYNPNSYPRKTILLRISNILVCTETKSKSRFQALAMCDI
jgi:hypothetical protein